MPILPVSPVVHTADELLASARTLIDATSAAFLADGELGVSCAAGCSACCSQAVPVTAAEVRSIAAAVGRLPEQRRLEVESKVAAGVGGLERAGLTHEPVSHDDHAAGRSFAAAYFSLDISCPLLFDGVCSVRADRPLACREYLVVSDPVHCHPSNADEGRVVRIRSRRDVRQGFADASAAFGEPGRRLLTWALADVLFGEGPPTAPHCEPRSGPAVASMLTAAVVT